VKHLKPIHLFEADQELLTNLNEVFKSALWQERFALIGVYPKYYKYHTKNMGPGDYEANHAENDRIDFHPIRRDNDASEQDMLSPYQILMGIISQKRYRGSTPWVHMPGFLLTLGRDKTPRIYRMGRDKETGQFSEVRIEYNSHDVSMVENFAIGTYIKHLKGVATSPSEGRHSQASALLIDILSGNLDREKAIRRVAKYLVKIAKEVDGDSLHMVSLVPRNYGEQMLSLDGYTPEEARAIMNFDEIGGGIF
jgi:hypothetical protein